MEGTDDSSDVANSAIEELCTKSYSHSRQDAIERATARLARSPRLRKLRTRAAILALLLKQPNPHTFRALTDLYVDFVQTGHGLVNVLLACPNLISLEIWRYTGTSDAIPRHAVPLLRKLVLPLALAGKLVDGRPVQSIFIKPARDQIPNHGFHWSKQMLIPLTLGSAPVRELSFPGYRWREDGMGDIFQLFPLLETLEVHFKGASQPVSCITPSS